MPDFVLPDPSQGFCFTRLRGPSTWRLVWVDGDFDRRQLDGILDLSSLSQGCFDVFSIRSEAELLDVLSWAELRPYVFVGLVDDAAPDTVWQISQRAAA